MGKSGKAAEQSGSKNHASENLADDFRLTKADEQISQEVGKSDQN